MKRWKGGNTVDEVLLEEVYFYDTMQEAKDAVTRMRAERPCIIGFDYHEIANGHVKLTVEVGDKR